MSFYYQDEYKLILLQHKITLILETKFITMKKLCYALLACVSFISIISCSDDFDDNPKSKSVNDFIWKGLNQYYYWLEDSPDLADNRFSNNSEYETFLKSFTSPRALFNHLTIDDQIDRFSVLFSDYIVLEQALSGTQKNNGVDFELRYINGSSTDIFGWVRYILPNSDASGKNIYRGDIFYGVNGISLTVDNYRNLLSQDTYTLNLADYNNGIITPNGNSVTLSKQPFSENPVHLVKTFPSGNNNIGYLMYNGFFSQYEDELNAAFAYFQNENITHLILDLRYNSGGSVNTATRLASMVTGQFDNQVFAKQQWNYKLEDYLNSNDPEELLNRFTTSLGNGNTINSLNLNSIYILTSENTASASELIINGLKSYINVTQIGDVTVGKNVGSITLYDSPNFRKVNINPNHKYAMQPIVLKIANNDGFSDYTNGLNPDVTQIEDISDLGVLGEVSDPLLSTALNYIDANGRVIPQVPAVIFKSFKDRKALQPMGNEMYLER
jgi:C-terminal processing protease CtpA/Prc